MSDALVDRHPRCRVTQHGRRAPRPRRPRPAGREADGRADRRHRPPQRRRPDAGRRPSRARPPLAGCRRRTSPPPRRAPGDRQHQGPPAALGGPAARPRQRAIGRGPRPPPTSGRSSRADVVVALDADTYRAAWLLARRYPAPDVVVGAAAGKQAVDGAPPAASADGLGPAARAASTSSRRVGVGVELQVVGAPTPGRGAHDTRRRAGSPGPSSEHRSCRRATPGARRDHLTGPRPLARARPGAARSVTTTGRPQARYS